METKLFLEERARVDGMKQEENIIKSNRLEREIKRFTSERITDIGKLIQWYLVWVSQKHVS
jgi:hypothetical protein